MNKENNLNITMNTFEVLNAVSINLNRAISCCALLEIIDEIKISNKILGNNLFINNIESSVLNDLIMSIARICNNEKGNSPLLEKLCSLYSYNNDGETKKNIKLLKKDIMNLYKNKFEEDRHNRLAHTNINTLFSMKESLYSSEQIEEMIEKIKKLINYLLSIYKDDIEISNINELKTDYKKALKAFCQITTQK